MNISVGLVGLPNVGKSTLFNALTKSSIPAENYPFCTIDPHVAVTIVPDSRLNSLKKIYNSQEIIPTYIEFVDIAGLVKGASKGEGLGNQFLSHIKAVDMVAHVLRCFDDASIINTQSDVNPVRDFNIIYGELALKDYESAAARMQKLDGLIKKTPAGKQADAFALEKTQLTAFMLAVENDQLKEAAELARACELVALSFLVAKPFMILCNVAELDMTDPMANPYVKQVKAHFSDVSVVTVCAQFEKDLAGLSLEEKDEYKSMFGVSGSAIDDIITAAFSNLNLISFFTCGPKEIHAWAIENGWTIKKAAGRIHSDLERGFISATIFSWADMHHYKSENEIKLAGKMKTVGATYIVQDGDIVTVHFNV